MSYDEAREKEQLRLNGSAIVDFIDRHKQKSIPAGKRKTVFLFPAGMGSQLERATSPYDENNPAQQFQYETVWVTWEGLANIVDSPFLNLKMTKTSPPLPVAFRDKDAQIIVANGAVSFAPGFAPDISPYLGFTIWCDLNDIDWYIVGWDWRRRLADSQSFFLDRFLPHFRQRVLDDTGKDILNSKVYLVGHSAGGMLVNSILRSGHAFVSKVKKVITVGTPFYGYAGQLHRWTEGQELVNGFDILRPEIVKVICSLPGCYALHFVDVATFTSNLPKLKDDLKFPIFDYPSVDKVSGLPADPYNPIDNGPNLRYPPFALSGFDKDELPIGGSVVANLAAPLPSSLKRKLFCIRGAGPLNDTVSTVQWDFMRPQYMQQAAPTLLQEPIVDHQMARGDDTQPAWTARLASLPPNQVKTVEGLFVGHAFLMNHPQVLIEFSKLL